MWLFHLPQLAITSASTEVVIPTATLLYYYTFNQCDTLGIQGFLKLSGELVSFVELGQPDLIKVL